MDDSEQDETGENDPARRAELLVGVLNAVAILVAVAWLWSVVRAQQGTNGELDGITIAQRIDFALASMGLLAYAAIVAGVAQIVALLAHRSRR
jgi:hypothetical protein